VSDRGELTISKNNAAIRGRRAATSDSAIADVTEAEVSERRVEGAHATSATGTDLVLGDDLGVGVERAAVEDPVADALEGELAGGSRYAHFVAQADGEKRALEKCAQSLFLARLRQLRSYGWQFDQESPAMLP
jgi:hypothetical protein